MAFKIFSLSIFIYVANELIFPQLTKYLLNWENYDTFLKYIHFLVHKPHSYLLSDLISSFIDQETGVHLYLSVC